MHSELSVSRSFFPRRYTLAYDCRLKIRQHHLGVLADFILREILPREVFSERAISDLKGRDPSELLLDNIPPNLKPHGEELLFLAGQVTLDDGVEPEGSTQTLPFQIECNTKFSEFVGSHHISHTTSLVRKGALPNFVQPQNLGRTFPLEIRHLRLGLERFTTDSGINVFGITPTVTQTLLMDCHQEEVVMQLSAERLRSLEDHPFPESDQFFRIAEMIGQISEENLLEDYNGRIRRSRFKSSGR